MAMLPFLPIEDMDVETIFTYFFDFPISALSLLGKNLTVRGYIIYSETEATLAEFTRELMAHVKEDRLKVLVQEFPLARAAAAHRAIEGRETTGKVVLRVQ